MREELWDKQKRLKYEHHDMAPEDFTQADADRVRELANRDFVETRESDNVRLIVNSFMGFLTSKGYRIVKK